MKLRSVLKKLKKKKKASSEGVVHDEPQSPYESEVRMAQAKVQRVERASNSSNNGNWQTAPVEPASSPNKHQLRHQYETTKNSDVQQIQKLQQLQQIQQTKPSSPKSAQPMSKQRSVPVQRSSVSASKSSSSFQDDFGVVEPKGFQASPNETWTSFGATFGDSSGFFNASNSNRTERTAAESQSTARPNTSSSSMSTMSSPANSSFLSSTRSEDLSSPSDLSRISTSSSTLSSALNEIPEEKPSSRATTATAAVTTSSPSKEGRSDRSVQMGTSEKRQRPSPTLSHHKWEPPAPVAAVKSSLSSSIPQESSQGAAASALPTASAKRSSITARYTSALNSSTSSPAPKLFRTPSRPSVLDNHPLFRKKSMVEQRKEVFAKPQRQVEEEEREDQEVADADAPPPPPPMEEPEVAGTPPSKFSRIASSNSIVVDGNNKGATPVLANPRKLFSDNDDPKDAEGMAPTKDQNDATTTTTMNEDVSLGSIAASEAPTEEATVTPPEQQGQEEDQAMMMEQDQPTSVPYSPDRSEQEQETQETSFDEDKMPSLSGSSEFDAVSPPAFTTTDTVVSASRSSVAQSSKSTTVSYHSEQDSDDETAPIGELSFDSQTEGGSHTEEEFTVDSRDYTVDPDALSVLSEDYTTYTHELRHKKGPSDRLSRWIENTIFGMANLMCPMEEGDVYDA
ncbi:unnamed protein product [Cylindrotheca closterium]|uniref:Uncharacterized protein n=1 Tax=Cylindrotheca closterium TaxID=2856 RepID=A0AAD2GCA3_9STRA|nr:unnamed protein product [Cylindrotheca closterium]